jgi:hypothetical protein
MSALQMAFTVSLDRSRSAARSRADVARETACRWWAAHQQGGFEALPYRRTGRPKGDTLLTPQQQHIRELPSTQTSGKVMGMATSRDTEEAPLP